METFSVKLDEQSKCTILNMTIDNAEKTILLTPHTANVLLENLKVIKEKLTQLPSGSHHFH